ncbi:beta-phosphoglucomutase-like phosphatase (HAD superfamily) [Actinoplanes lutulentus]|uniref:Uncharacterized protein n=1 Tax=Actinoplanes lutulentus TaxID=1287878 RepID=A0A327ZB41_9ACTN|nr:hypothetical protein [Actinoplanes lutulentus]MBB2947369.1 beta-phosphoglucomutase-like phosphatase (HAD superfamily) [Actinoplanes lutulentus]RAK36643.1 hypothetical protein B0I29_108233 [Actinoplanes lutulentus]
MSLPDTVDAVIVDCDGLLVDTETCWTRAETILATLTDPSLTRWAVGISASARR